MISLIKKPLRYLRQSVYQARVEHYANSPKNRKSGILMWHYGRCGSTVLADMLNQHPDLFWNGEIFEPDIHHEVPNTDYRLILDRTQFNSRGKIPGIEIKGLPCQHYRFIKTSEPEFIDEIQKREFKHCIFITRKNILRMLISVQIRHQNLIESWNLDKNSKSSLSGQLTIDCNRFYIQGQEGKLLELINYVEEYEGKAWEEFSQSFNALRLSYEEHIQEDPCVAYNLSCKHLGLHPREATVNYNRINTKRLCDLVENFHDLESALAGTKHEWMLTS